MYGETLRKIRKAKKVTQFELAKQINVHPQRISEIEHNKGDFKFKQAIKTALFLNVSLNELANIEKEHDNGREKNGTIPD